MDRTLLFLFQDGFLVFAVSQEVHSLAELFDVAVAVLSVCFSVLLLLSVAFAGARDRLQVAVSPVVWHVVEEGFIHGLLEDFSCVVQVVVSQISRASPT